MSTLALAAPKRANGTGTPPLIKLLLIGIVVTMPYQRLIVFPALRQGYIVDLFILALIAVGSLVILSRRRPLRAPILLAHGLILAGSLLGTVTGLDRGESLATLANDMYVWVLFYVAINVIEDRQFLHTLIKVWVVVLVVESLVILYAVGFTADQRPTSGGGQPVDEKLQQVGSQSESGGPALDELPAEFTQAKHVLKRLERNTQLEGSFFVPGTGLGTFANGDFTGNYLAAGIFVVLALPVKGRYRWLQGIALALVTLATLLTGVSSQLPVIPVALAIYLFVLSPFRSRLIYVVGLAAMIILVLFAYLATPYIAGVDFFELFGEAESQTLTGGVAGISGGVEDRLSLVTDGWREFRDHPLGLGPHGMRASGVEKNVHNEYVSYLYERGVVGFLGLMAMIATIIVIGARSMANATPAHRAVMAGLLVAYVQVVINDLAHELSRQRDVWMLIVLVVSYAGVELRQRAAQRQANLEQNYPWAYAQPAYALATGEATD